MVTSIRITAGFNREANSMASLPLLASPTTSISSYAFNRLHNPWRTIAWSSTTSNRIFFPLGLESGSEPFAFFVPLSFVLKASAEVGISIKVVMIGNTSVATVPFPGDDWSSRHPPSESIRSRMLKSPNLLTVCVGGLAETITEGSNPNPWSATVT